MDFRVFDGKVAPPEEHVKAAVAEELQRQEALVGIEMRKLNHFINKPFENGFCVLEYSKLKMYVTYLFFIDVNKIKIVIFLYRYTFYALLKYAVGKPVRILYADTDSFFLHFFVEDLATEINARLHLRDAFDFSEISNGHLSNLGDGHAELHAGEVG